MAQDPVKIIIALAIVLFAITVLSLSYLCSPSLKRRILDSENLPSYDSMSALPVSPSKPALFVPAGVAVSVTPPTPAKNRSTNPSLTDSRQ